MDKCLKRLGALVLCCSLSIVGCGGDDDDRDLMGPEEKVGSELPPEALFLTGALIQTFQSAFFASLAADTTSIAGIAGTVQIMGNTWVLEEFSPDGQLFLDGTLNVGKDLFPNIPVTGTLMLSGVQEGTLELDMVIVVEGTDIAGTGTISINGVVFNLADLIDAGEAAGEAAEAGG